MEKVIGKLIDEGVYEKRNGNFELSLNCYLKAIDTEPTDKTIYKGLGKVAYLADNPLLSTLSYLSYMHIEMNAIEKQIVDGVLPAPLEEMYHGLPDDLKEILPKKSGILLFHDYNIKKHLAHTVLDTDPSRPDSLGGIAAIYRAQIQDKVDYDYSELYDKYQLTSDQMIELEEEVYLPRGFEVMLDLIQWDKILSNDVINIYFDEDNPII